MKRPESEEQGCMKWGSGLHNWMVVDCNIGIGYVLPDGQIMKDSMK